MSNPIAIITARSGSKGLKDKNMLFFGGKPLLIHSVDAAINSGKFKPSDVYVSTDSLKYKRIIEHLRPEINVVLRKPELALDTTTSFEVLEDFLADFEDDQVFMLLQPTSPMRSKDDICRAFEMMDDGAECVVSFSSFDKGLDFYTRLDKDGAPIDLLNRLGNYRRQDMETVYIPNGSIYLIKKGDYIRHRTFFYGDTRAMITSPRNSIDIDGINDFRQALGVLSFDFSNDNLSLSLSLSQKSLKLSPVIGGSEEVIFADFRANFLHNEGISTIEVGRMTSGDFALALPEILEAGEIKRAVLAIGTSDAIFGVSGEEFGRNLEKILDIFEEFAVEVRVLPLMPVLYRAEINSSKIEEFNDILRKVCQNRAEVADEFLTKITDADGDLLIEYALDGLELNHDGEKLVTDCIFH